MLGAEHLRAIYTLYHGTPPTHFFDFSLRGDIEHLILSGRIKAFYLSEDKTERLGNPQDVLYANPDSIDLNCESPVVAQRYRLAEELATDIMARWTQKDAEDLAHWDRFVLWRKGYETYDITAEAFDTVYDFIVGLKDIAVFVVEISYEAAKTQLKVNRALLEMTYKGATGDIDGLRADLAKVGVMVDEKIDSAQKLIAQAEQGKKIFDALVNDPLTRNLIFDFLDSLYQSISYRESRTFKARIVFEIGIEVLLALATAGIGNVARRTAQTARATTNAIKATKTAQRIGPFTKHALDLMADLAKVMNKPIHVEEIPPVKGLELPDFGKLSKSELGGVGEKKPNISMENSADIIPTRHSGNAPHPGHPQFIGPLKPNSETVFSGHGSYYPSNGTTTVPDGTTLTVYSKPGATISDTLGNRVELGGDLTQVYKKTFKSGEELPDYVLHSAPDLNIQGTPITVIDDTPLSSLLKPNMGNCHWAACTYNPYEPTSNMMFHTDGIIDTSLKKYITIYDKSN